MSRYTGPKARRCRREGVNIYSSDKYQKILQNRPGTPGVHGASLRKKNTEYGSQLREKQKLRFMFGVTEKQMTNYYKKASSKIGDTGQQFMILLESRLDNCLFRSGFVKTRNQARQLVTHGHVILNGKKSSAPSTQIKEGDVVEIKKASKDNEMFKNPVSDKYVAPKWLKADKKALSFMVQSLPNEEDFEQMIEMHLIVEFYSR